MGPGATYRICSGEPRDEDFSCSDSLSFDPELYKKYIHDHRFYFGQRVSFCIYSNTLNYFSGDIQIIHFLIKKLQYDFIFILLFY